ncbi:unnamed protein product [Meganyctiphanes norvegica]|uniref:WAP domain-containing protein n=1 Tax=Meganyctiphanes norvegica TaxID=48144 RepID=A0AAV2SJC1_MEGNR
MVRFTHMLLLVSIAIAQETTETAEGITLSPSDDAPLGVVPLPVSEEKTFAIRKSPADEESNTSEDQVEEQPDTEKLVGNKIFISLTGTTPYIFNPFNFVRPTAVIIGSTVTSTVTNTLITNTVTSSSNSANCRYWCRNSQNQYYCCESSSQIITTPTVKPGSCPAVRPDCPPTRHFIGPVTCSNDGSCGGTDKCCYDTCLEQHICKPIVATTTTSTTTITVTLPTITWG